MEIRTKFKPKDKIWAIETINGRYFIAGKFIVTDIKQDKNLGVIYKVDRLQTRNGVCRARTKGVGR